MGHQGRESVVVAESDLIGGHGVVFVDDRHGVQCPKPVESARRIGVLRSLGNVVRGQQHLSHGAAVPGEGRTPGVDQCHLTDAGRGLLGGQIGGPSAQTQGFDTGGNGTGRNDDHIRAGLHPCLDGIDQGRQSRTVEQPG